MKNKPRFSLIIRDAPESPQQDGFNGGFVGQQGIAVIPDNGDKEKSSVKYCDGYQGFPAFHLGKVVDEPAERREHDHGGFDLKPLPEDTLFKIC